MNNDKEEQLLKKRFFELSKIADLKGICTYTDFLNLNEISIFKSINKELPNVNYQLYGGYEDAERNVICFYGDESVKAFSSYITCIRIKPLNKKFSDDLTHRDFLGAIMNLRLERSKIGDILVKEKEAYVFCLSSISSFIIDNLNKIKHTSIQCERMNEEAPEIRPTFKEIRGTISSPRLDSIIALAFGSSRSSMLNLISSGNVFVDGRLVESNSYVLKKGDIVSVRGHGKFIYKELQNQTKKGRYYCLILKYT